MSENSMRIALPRLPDLEVFSNPERTIRTAAGDALLTYDPATASAFIYNLKRETWSISTPIDFETFAAMCAMSGFAVSDTDDARRWMAANSTPAKPGQLN